MFRTVQIVLTNAIFSNWVSTAGGIILLWYGSILVINRELSIGQLLAFNSLNTNILGLVNTCVRFITDFTRAQAATERLNEVINSTPEFSEVSQKPFVNIPDNADIICKDINFHHAGRVDLLKDFSLTLPGGKVIAIIGKSGCGKSTLAKLIASLYHPQSGNIRIHHYNLSDINPSCLRQQIVLIPQDAHFWSRS
ncbi:MAG: ATP-binding cassette domain-containing protein, partial [Sphaerospermopsis kisseleviana]